MATRNRIIISERQAATLWQQSVGRKLSCSQGDQVTVIYPGRASHNEGPDFRDALIVNGLSPTAGDVEVHVKSSDWYSHGHHCDPKYNNVILHVALWQDSDSITVLQSGKRIPLLPLARALRYQSYLLPPELPCTQMLNNKPRHMVHKALDAAGDERFKCKAMRFRAALQREHPGQVLFKSIMRALGYAKNTKPFEELATRIPFSFLESRIGLLPRQALLLGTAGLLPSQREPRRSARGKETQELCRIWQSLKGDVEPMTESDWHFSQIYPNNSPVRRMVAASHILERYSTCTLLAGMLQLVREASLANGHIDLENGLTVAGRGYWRHHLDFGVRIRGRTSALLGNSKAREVVTNVILPFAFSWGKTANEQELAESALGLYRNYPRLAENYLTRHMARQLCLEQRLDLTARRQQGLLHIFRHYCCQGRCSVCPLAR